MGFLIRAALVVGIVYALSPLRDDRVPLGRQAAAALEGVPTRAAEAAVALCGEQVSCLARAAALAGQVAAPSAAGPGSPREAHPRAATNTQRP